MSAQPQERQPAHGRGLSMGLICGFWERNTLLIMSNSTPLPRASCAHRELGLSVLLGFLELW